MHLLHTKYYKEEMSKQFSKQRDLVANHVYVNQTSLVNEMVDGAEHFLDPIENFILECEALGNELCSGCQEGTECDAWEYKEIFEWWAVSEWLLKRLREHGEPVLDCAEGRWWGRTTTGQAVYLDSVIMDVVNTSL